MVAIELGFRALCALDPDTRSAIDAYRDHWMPDAGFSLDLRPHPHYGYVNRTSRDVNRFGFYYDGAIAFKKPRNTLRVLCYGGSTTAGPEAWPFHLQAELQSRFPTREVEVLNFGVSGWTSAESAAAHALLGQSYEHDLVILHNVNNDIKPILSGTFTRDYSHFRRAFSAVEQPDGTWDLPLSTTARIDRAASTWSDLYIYARLWTVGPPAQAYSVSAFTEHAGAMSPQLPIDVERQRARTYLRNLHTIAALSEAQGARVMLATMPSRRGDGIGAPPPGWAAALERQNGRMAVLARDNAWALAPLHTEIVDMDDHFEDYIHVDQTGERRKAALIARAIAQAKLLR